MWVNNIFLKENRSSFSKYLRNRMITIASNLIIMVGDLLQLD